MPIRRGPFGPDIRNRVSLGRRPGGALGNAPCGRLGHVRPLLDRGLRRRVQRALPLCGQEFEIDQPQGDFASRSDNAEQDRGGEKESNPKQEPDEHHGPF